MLIISYTIFHTLNYVRIYFTQKLKKGSKEITQRNNVSNDQIFCRSSFSYLTGRYLIETFMVYTNLISFLSFNRLFKP